MIPLRVTLTREFGEDLSEIVAYLEGAAGPRIAERWATRLREAAESLGAAPAIAARDDRLGQGRRRLVVAPYLIVYELHGDEVLVLRVVHGARDLPALFGG